jgi:hypothetical protein
MPKAAHIPPISGLLLLALKHVAPFANVVPLSIEDALQETLLYLNPILSAPEGEMCSSSWENSDGIWRLVPVFDTLLPYVAHYDGASVDYGTT